MNDLTVLFSNIIRSEIDDKFEFDSDLSALTEENLKKVYVILKQHDLLHFLSDALYKNNLTKRFPTVYEKANKHQMLAVFRTERIKYESERVSNGFEKAEIPFILLKGSVLRDLYPESWMRTSCDIDILVKESDLEKASEYLVKELNFRLESRERHDWSLFSESNIHIELHFDLIEDNWTGNASEILKDVWDYSFNAPDKKYQYLLKDEMFYFYHIAHMAKHFENGGCGIRPFIDLWILNHRVQFDKEKRNAILREGNLLKFAENAEKLSEIWFGEERHNEITQNAEKYIVAAGVYGTTQNHIAVLHNKGKGKIKYFFSKIFMNYSDLKRMFPILEKYKILFPFAQVARWFKRIKEGRVKQSVNLLKINNNISKEESNEIAKLFDDFGL